MSLMYCELNEIIEKKKNFGQYAIAVVCFPTCDPINFEINLTFLI